MYNIANARNTALVIATMASMTLFPNCAPQRLLDAIAKVESDNGRTSRNIYQLQPEYVADVNRIQRKRSRVDGIRRERFTCDSVYDRETSERMMDIYWSYYCVRIGSWTEETMARLHRVGPTGLRRGCGYADKYWLRVRRAMAR